MTLGQMRRVCNAHQNMFPNLSRQWLHWNSQLPHQSQVYFHPETKWILGPLIKNSARLPYITNISLVLKQEFNLHRSLMAQELSEASLGVFFLTPKSPKNFPPLYPIPGCARAPRHLQRTTNHLPGFQLHLILFIFLGFYRLGPLTKGPAFQLVMNCLSGLPLIGRRVHALQQGPHCVPILGSVHAIHMSRFRKKDSHGVHPTIGVRILLQMVKVSQGPISVDNSKFETLPTQFDWKPLRPHKGSRRLILVC